MSLQVSVTAGGQVTLEQSVLEHLGIRSGDRVRVALLPDGRGEMRAVDSFPGIARLRGALHRPGQAAVSLAGMQQAIEAGADE